MSFKKKVKIAQEDKIVREGSSRSAFELKFTNSSPSLLSPEDVPDQSGQSLLESRTAAALRLHHARLSGYSDRWALCFLLVLSLLLAWVIGHFQASPALLILLGVAALAIGRGRWQQVVEGAGLEAELKVRRKVRTQLRGETAEWVNFMLNRWLTTCNETVLAFVKEYVEPLLADLLPPGIDSVEVVEVDFGEHTPLISNVRFTELPTSREVDCDRDTCTLVMNFDLTIPSPDSQIILRARVGSKSIGSNHLVYVDSLYVNGSIQALVVLDSQAPFPNVIKIVATFSSKPDIWFSVKVLKGLRVTNIPILKKIIHSVVMDMFTTLLVDPGKLTMNFDPCPLPSAVEGDSRHAEGVITVTITGRTPQTGKAAHGGDPRRWLTLRLRDRKYQEQLVLEKGAWQGTYSFLVYDLRQDVLVLKIKLRRVIYSNTLAVHSVNLDTLGFISPEGEEVQTERVVSFSNSVMEMQLGLCYSPLPSFSLHARNNFPPISKDQACGVLCVHVHSGQELMGCDANGLSDPYCVVKANKEKILRTHHVCNTLSPCWERGVEVFVSDVTQVVLSFLVLDWDGPFSGDDLLGVAKLNLSETSSELIQHKLTLVADTEDNQLNLPLGHITVSVIFRPVAATKKSSPQCRVSLVGGALPLTRGGVAAAKNGANIKNLRKRRKEYYSSEGHMTQGMLELKLIRGRDLVPKDSNGLSDPYVVVKYGSQIVFRSKVIKKSLNPEWNEVATLTPPSSDDIIHVECWDKDIFSDDFMGSMQFTDRGLQIFQDKEQWCHLEHVKHGQLLIRLFLSEGEDNVRWSSLDEASRQMVGGAHMLEERDDMRGTVVMRTPSQQSVTSSSSVPSSNLPEDSSDAGTFPTTVTSPNPSTSSGTSFSVTRPLPHPQSAANIQAIDHTPSVVNSSSNDGSLSSQQPAPLRRRHTLSHQTRPPDQDISLVPRYPETTADIQWALNRAAEGSSKHHTSERSGYREKQITFFHNVSGQVIEATGLKGELDHMELYVKVRLNTRPSYQRQHKFGRGPVVHKTRVLRGSHSLQWKEDFMVKESPVASDALLTFDLKRGSKINIGTYAITLDKYFEGNLKATRSFDIGNDVKLRVKLSRQLR